MRVRLDELAWISRCKLFRDEKAFAKLLDAWSGRIRKFFLLQTGGDEMLSDDLAQETFIRIWTRLPELKQAVSFPGWAYRTAYNIWMDYLRSRKLSEPIEGLDVADAGSAGGPAGRRELHQLLLSSLARLNEQERTVTTLFYLSELSIKEICAVTGMNEGTVKSHLSRSRAKLRQLPELISYHNE